MAVVTGTSTANVPLSPWEDGLWLLQYLQRFLLRCWHPLKNTESAEDMLVRQWLILSLPKLDNVLVRTGARRKQGRLVFWDQHGSWQKICKKSNKYADTDVDFF